MSNAPQNKHKNDGYNDGYYEADIVVESLYRTTTKRAYRIFWFPIIENDSGNDSSFTRRAYYSIVHYFRYFGFMRY